MRGFDSRRLHNWHCTNRLPAVHLAPVGDSSDYHEALVVVDGVHDSVLADSNAIVAAPSELDGARWAGVEAERVDCGCDAIAERVVETSVRPRGLRVQADFVRVPALAGYARTSVQGRVVSRSSRARTAARLSSRYSRRSMSSA